MPFESLDSESAQPYEGIVQLTDLLGNPTNSNRDLKIKLEQDGDKIANVPRQVIIEEGTSYATFPITPIGENGDSTITASLKGVIGSEGYISTTSNLLGLKIFANGIATPLDIEKPLQLEVFVDDENAESVRGATVQFITDSEVASITPEDTRTNSDGGIVADLTVHKGPLVSIQVIATADGYQEESTTFDYEVKDSGGDSLALGLPDWVLYVGVAAVLGIVAVVVMFLRKPKEADIDEDEDYEYEEEI